MQFRLHTYAGGLEVTSHFLFGKEPDPVVSCIQYL